MRRSSRNRALAVLLVCAALVTLPACSFLADEFGWLDRAPSSPRAATAGTDAGQ